MKIKKVTTLVAFLALNATLFAQDTISLFFANNKYQLSVLDERKLSQIASQIKNRQIEKNFSIIGYADFVGNPESNQILSLKRAKSVEEHLLNNGVKPQEINSTIGVGSTCCEHFPLPNEGCQTHRRVDIIFHAKPPVVKVQKTDTIIQPIEKKVAVVEDISESILNTEVGETLLLDHINFVGGSDVWLEESVPSIEKLLDVLTENPTIKIEIQGHICCASIDESDLSTRRALAIYKYLIANGIDKKRLSYRGFGRTKPLINNLDETKNRRVEILIQEK